MLCLVSCNGHMQLVDHNQLKKHKTTLHQRGLIETRDVMTYVNKYDSPISYQGNFLLDCSQNNGLLKRKKFKYFEKTHIIIWKCVKMLVQAIFQLRKITCHLDYIERDPSI